MEYTKIEWMMTDALEELPVGVCVLQIADKEGAEKYLFCNANREFFECIGYQPNEFPGNDKTIYRILVRDDRRKMQDMLDCAAEHDDISYSEIFGVRHKDGMVYAVQWSVRRMQDGAGGFGLLCCINRLDAVMREKTALKDKLNNESQEKKRLNNLIYELPVGVAVVKGGNDITLEDANAGFLKVQGYSASELKTNAHSFLENIYSADVEKLESAIDRCRSKRTVEELELRVLTKDGDVRWELVQCRLYYYCDAIPYYILTSWDINARKILEDELRLRDEQYQMLEELTDEFPLEYDVGTECFRVPKKYHENGKVTDPDKKYMKPEEMLDDILIEDQSVFAQAIMQAAREETTGTVDYRLNVAPEGRTPVYVWYRTVYRSIVGVNGWVNRVIGRSYDISSDRKIQEALSEEMRLDPLTKLLNKVAVGEEINQFLCSNPEGTNVMFLIDIDNFKQVNDTFGHIVGDTVICDIANILQKQFRKTDIVGRVGGDEFIAFMKSTSMEHAIRKAERLCQAAAKKLNGDNVEVSLTLSVGIAVYHDDGDDYETLFDMADQAMYQTKRSGKNGFSFVKKGEQEENGALKRNRTEEDTHLRNTELDKEFLHIAFNLLSHAKDINGSLNVLIEQIGKKYGVDVVSVFEYEDNQREMTLTNSWNRFEGVTRRQVTIPRTIMEFKEADVGAFVVTDGESMRRQNPDFWKLWKCDVNRISHIAGSKFEFYGNRMGCLYMGISRRDEGFSAVEENTLCELSRVVSVFVTLRSKLREDQREIRHLQDRDQLTGLYNLDAFRTRVSRVLQGPEKGGADQRSPKCYALAHVDINDFSYVNENFGQQVGDEILREFAKMLQKDENILESCRMYSDFFVEFVAGESREDIYQKISRSNQMFEDLQKIKYPASSMHLSSGICYAGDCGMNFETVLEGANLARKQAKEHKSRTAVVYCDSMRERRDDEIRITGRFYAAMQKGEIELFLQPKFLLDEQTIYGAEALARWRLPGGDLLPPDRFIPPLENVGYIVDLDFCILEQLLRAMKRWKDSGRKLFTISTNFSRRNFDGDSRKFVERLQAVVARYGIEPKYIEIEITESVIAENLSGLKGCLDELAKLGYRIAIDDFGTGYSSLSALLEIPANVIKIDKSFTDRIDLKEQRNFVAQMGKFIRSAKEEVIFEGIEEQRQCKFLLDCGFRYGQGYLFDRPIPVSEFERKYI